MSVWLALFLLPHAKVEKLTQRELLAYKTVLVRLPVSSLSGPYGDVWEHVNVFSPAEHLCCVLWPDQKLFQRTSEEGFSLGPVIFLKMFLGKSLLCSSKPHLFNQKYSKYYEILQ